MFVYHIITKENLDRDTDSEGTYQPTKGVSFIHTTPSIEQLSLVDKLRELKNEEVYLLKIDLKKINRANIQISISKDGNRKYHHIYCPLKKDVYTKELVDLSKILN